VNCSVGQQLKKAGLSAGCKAAPKTIKEQWLRPSQAAWMSSRPVGKQTFLHPVINADTLDQGLLGDWLSTQETLEACFTKFDQVLGSSSFITKVNEITLEEERRAAIFKTTQTKKQRTLDLDLSQCMGISPYAHTLLNADEEFEDMTLVDPLSTLSLMEDIQGLRTEMLCINTENKPQLVKFAGLNLDSLAKARA
jgi:hypothetical protein